MTNEHVKSEIGLGKNSSAVSGIQVTTEKMNSLTYSLVKIENTE